MSLITHHLPSIKYTLFVLTFIISGCSTTQLIPSNPPDFSQAHIYINQLAFDVNSPKQAVVSLPVDESATRFIVYKGSDIVYQSTLKQQPSFNEWGSGSQFYLADFTSIQRRGEFHIVINTQKQQIKSSPFTIKQNASIELTAQSLLDYFKASRNFPPQNKLKHTEDKILPRNNPGAWHSPGDSDLNNLKQPGYLTLQQSSLAVWSLAKSYNKLSEHYDRKNMTPQLIEEIMWGADYLHRTLANDGYFLKSTNNNHISKEDLNLNHDKQLNKLKVQVSFREGAGLAIAALASAHELSLKTHIHGDFTTKQYLIDAEKAFLHLQKNNLTYIDNGKENMTDDYSALIAATALYRITQKKHYLISARHRAHNLNSRISPQGWFIRDGDEANKNHDAEFAFPVIALVDYLTIEPKSQIKIKTKHLIKTLLNYQISLNTKISNPFNLARHTYTGSDSSQNTIPQPVFFMPHTSEENNWHGENARLSSLAAAAIWAGKYTHADRQGSFAVNTEVANFAQSQIDWIMGKNPYQVCMLYGFGITNPPHPNSAGNMLNGGVSNGISGATLNADGSGITWAEGPDENNWRWTQQRLQNSAWFLLAITAMAE